MSSRLSTAAALGATLVCAVGIGLLQAPLMGQLRNVKLRDDMSALPPARDVRVLAFGYRAAAADAVWASLLVEQGTRASEKRPFAAVTRYIDAIIELDPKHPSIYKFADSLIIYRTVGVADEADARMARAYLERGTKEFPYDHRIWLQYGQFLAFLGPSFLKDEAEVEQWRRDGAFAMARAVELGEDADRVLTVATLLGKAGETKAQIANLQRAYAMTDNPDTRQQILMKLQRLNASTGMSEVVEVVEQEWQRRFPFLSRGSTLLLGPQRDPALCAGPESWKDPRCPRDWTAATSFRR